MRQHILFTVLVFLFGHAQSQTLVANPQNNALEGGELQLMNSNASYNPWNIDNYAGRLRFHHGGSTFFDMDPSGVTAIPNSVRLNGALRIAPESGFVAEGSISESTWGNYMLTNNTTTRNLRLGVSNDGYTRGEIEIENNNSASSSIFFKTTNTNGGAQVRMKIADNGHVGIGTVQPTETFHLVGNSLYDAGNGASIKINGYHGIETQGNPHWLHLNRYSNDHVSIGHNSTSNVYMTHGGGKVGIGTTAPDAKLTVKGNIHAEEVKVDLSVPGPDYVFKEGYDLKSLNEVQDYIRANGHLPNIPSAKEMEENGIQLGEFNMKLLEKIEELTLYALQQERKLDQQQEQLKELDVLKERMSEIEKRINQKR